MEGVFRWRDLIGRSCSVFCCLLRRSREGGEEGGSKFAGALNVICLIGNRSRLAIWNGFRRITCWIRLSRVTYVCSPDWKFPAARALQYPVEFRRPILGLPGVLEKAVQIELGLHVRFFSNQRFIQNHVWSRAGKIHQSCDSRYMYLCSLTD